MEVPHDDPTSKRSLGAGLLKCPLRTDLNEADRYGSTNLVPHLISLQTLVKRRPKWQNWWLHMQIEVTLQKDEETI